MHNLPLPQEPDGIVDIGIVTEPQDIVVGNAGLLLRCQILCQIRDHLTGDLHGSGAPRRAGGGDRINAGSMIHKVSVKPGGSDLIFTEVSGELMDDGSNHLQVPQLFGSYLVLRNVPN